MDVARGHRRGRGGGPPDVSVWRQRRHRHRRSRPLVFTCRSAVGATPPSGTRHPLRLTVVAIVTRRSWRHGHCERPPNGPARSGGRRHGRGYCHARALAHQRRCPHVPRTPHHARHGRGIDDLVARHLLDRRLAIAAVCHDRRLGRLARPADATLDLRDRGRGRRGPCDVRGSRVARLRTGGTGVRMEPAAFATRPDGQRRRWHRHRGVCRAAGAGHRGRPGTIDRRRRGQSVPGVHANRRRTHAHRRRRARAGATSTAGPGDPGHRVGGVAVVRAALAT